MAFSVLRIVTATLYWLFGALLTITIVAAPIGLGLMEYGKFLFSPFGHVGTVLNPVNKVCVPIAVAEELERRKGEQQIARHLGPKDAA